MARRPCRIASARLSGLVLLACVGSLATGCTFERRPATGESAEGQEVPGGILDESGERPGAFLQRFQQARRDASPEETRALVHPDARFLRNGSILPSDVGSDSATGGVAVLALPDGGGEADPVPLETIELGDAALYVLRYPDRVETLLLARDSVGWRLRLFHQVSGPPDG